MRRIPTILVTSVMLQSLDGTFRQEDMKTDAHSSPEHKEVSSRISMNQEAEWKEIMALYEEGVQILSRLKQTPADKDLLRKRQSVFLQAAQKLESWISKYEPDVNSLVFLRSTYRLGNYWEFAYEFKKAQSCYRNCEKHPLLQSARFDGKPLASQLASRLSEVEKNKDKEYKSPGYVVETRRVGGGGKSAGKGRISKSVIVPDQSKPPKIVKDFNP